MQKKCWCNIKLYIFGPEVQHWKNVGSTPVQHFFHSEGIHNDVCRAAMCPSTLCVQKARNIASVIAGFRIRGCCSDVTHKLKAHGLSVCKAESPCTHRATQWSHSVQAVVGVGVHTNTAPLFHWLKQNFEYYSWANFFFDWLFIYIYFIGGKGVNINYTIKDIIFEW